MKCFCKSDVSYENCCGRYIDGDNLAPNPEVLMRSRYSAYVQGKIDYIAKTMTGPAAVGFDQAAAKKWASDIKWQGLQVIKAWPVKPDDTVGYVEFMARYEHNGKPYILHEKSKFELIDGAWLYVDGVTPKIGRNDLCPCGSGKKYKKCCNNPMV